MLNWFGGRSSIDQRGNGRGYDGGQAERDVDGANNLMVGVFGIPPGGFGTIPVRPMTFEDLEVAMRKVSDEVEPWDASRILFVRPLQEAARNSGQVVLMEDRQEQRYMAVKQMPTGWVCCDHEEFSSRYAHATERPWQDFGFVSHLGDSGFPYVCELFGVFRSEQETFVATTFCPEGDLFAWCDDRSTPRPGAQRDVYMRPIVGQIFAAVRWLHELGIAHRDLSLENLLLLRDGPIAKVKVIDFGMATVERFVKNEIRGKSSYQAPEVHVQDEVIDTFLLDEFALGVVLFAMGAHDYPWTCTKRGTCQLFEYVSRFGFRQFLSKRKLRGGQGEYLIDALTTDLVDLSDALMNFDQGARAVLGEACYDEEVRKRCRPSVWDMDFMKGLAE